MNEIDLFREEVARNVRGLRADMDLQAMSRIWIREIVRHKYSYNFSWLGRPIIQFPQDVLVLQELIWKIRPRWIIETGIAHGGSLIMSASILELIGDGGRVIGVDIDIREHNRREIEGHPMFRRIDLIEGSSIDEATVRLVQNRMNEVGPVLVILDSNHTHDHVLHELELYSPMVTAGSYMVVLDTIIEDMPLDMIIDRPWGPGNSPKTAVHEFMRQADRFEIDKDIESKLLITSAPDGFLKCIK